MGRAGSVAQEAAAGLFGHGLPHLQVGQFRHGGLALGRVGQGGEMGALGWIGLAAAGQSLPKRDILKPIRPGAGRPQKSSGSKRRTGLGEDRNP